MTFKDQLATDAVNCFLNSNEFSEEITYTPYGGTARTIKAIVDRHPPEPADESAGRSLKGVVEVTFANDATYGTASIARGFDRLSFPQDVGGTDVVWVIEDVIKQDDGIWQVRAVR